MYLIILITPNSFPRVDTATVHSRKQTLKEKKNGTKRVDKAVCTHGPFSTADKEGMEWACAAPREVPGGGWRGTAPERCPEQMAGSPAAQPPSGEALRTPQS